MYDILVFKNTDNNYVTLQPYQGRIPPALTQARFDGEVSPFHLTVHEYEGKSYLLAHEHPLPKDIADAAIENFRPKAL